MLPVELKWNWRDIPNAGRRGFSFRKIALHARGVLLGYLLLIVLFYAVNLVAGMTFEQTWRHYGLSALAMLSSARAFPLFGLAALLAGLTTLLLVLHYGTAVSKLTYEQLKGDYWYPPKSALEFAGRHSRDAVGALTCLMLLLVAVRLVVFLAGLLGRIPVVGEWIAALGAFLLIPAYFVGLLFSLIAVALVVGFFLGPSIAGIVGVDALETTYQLFVLLWNQPWRILVYEALLFLTQAVAGAIFYAMGFWGFAVLLDTMGAGYPPLKDAFGTAAAIVWGRELPLILGYALQFERVSGLSPAMTLATALSVIAYLFVTCVSISYVLSIGSVGNTLLYVNLRRRVRGDNVLEISPEVRSEEEPVAATATPDESAPSQAGESSQPSTTQIP